RESKGRFMKHLQKTLAMIAFLCLAAQTVRHAYMLWLEPRGSALDKYDQPAKEQIAAAVSLDELMRRYDAVRKQVDLAKEEQAKAAKQQSGGTEQGLLAERVQDNQKEPFKSEQLLREAIVEWESKWKEIHALRFYWLLGFTFFLVGIVIYQKWNRW